MAALPLNSQADVQKLQHILQSTLRQKLQDIFPTESPDGHVLLTAMTAWIEAHLEYCITKQRHEQSGEDNSITDGTVPPDDMGRPREDDEARQLEQQIVEAAKRVENLRTDASASIQDYVSRYLDHKQDMLEARDVGSVEGSDGEVGLARAFSPEPATLQNSLAATLGRMPALRARLEEILDRLDRVVSAIQADQNRSPAGSLVPGQPTPTTSAVSPACLEAMRSGKISQRRRLAKELRPVPYPMV